jgi:GDP-4-dehydro-6-deoxy-D-mannose reductase
MKILVIGDTGFVAGYLLPYLVERFPGCSMYGMARHDPEDPNVAVEHLRGDTTSTDEVAEIVKRVLPDIVINLSSFSSVSESWAAPVACHQINYFGVLNLCLAITEHVPNTKLIHISSLEVYGGNADQAVCYNESSPLNPRSPYAVSKAASEFIIQQYGASHGLHYTILRPSNHTGPRRKPLYVLSGFAKQLAEIKRGLRQPVLSVGNLNVHRDFVDVRDVVRAYGLVLTSDRANQQIFNVCSGSSYPISWLLDHMIKTAGVNVEIRIDPARFRPADANYLRGNNSKIKDVTGWRPEIPIETTLQDLLAFWEKSIQL